MKWKKERIKSNEIVVGSLIFDYVAIEIQPHTMAIHFLFGFTVVFIDVSAVFGSNVYDTKNCARLHQVRCKVGKKKICKSETDVFFSRIHPKILKFYDNHPPTDWLTIQMDEILQWRPFPKEIRIIHSKFIALSIIGLNIRHSLPSFFLALWHRRTALLKN